jgi:hypothetical protein
MCMNFSLLIRNRLRPFIGVSIGVLGLIPAIYSQSEKVDSVVVPASTKYINCPPLTLLFVGKNYRREWSTPVKMPVFHLKKQNGGFTIKELGGGQQTKSLRLLDKNGQEWVLRTTDKDVTKSLEVELKSKLARDIVKDIVQDMISAAHPYASMTVPALAKAAGVTVANPKLFYVPDDPAFGEFRSLFANTVCFLEDREPTPDQSETESTLDVMEKVLEKNDHLLLQKAILKARLLDMLIADWDRHEDQWKWGTQKKGEKTYYYPVPKDRDFAFFKSDGLVVLFSSMVVLPHLNSFTNDGSALKKLSNKTWEMDAQWLNQLGESDWENAIIDFQNKVTDSVIEAAVKKMPAEIYSFSGKKFQGILSARRDGLLKHAMKYYRFLAANAFIIGTDDQEFFTIKKEGDNITVIGSATNPADKDQVIYQRTFTRKDTRKIFIKGLGGKDHFDIDENVSSSIILQLEGGDGEDVYNVKGDIKTRIEDHNNAGSKMSLAGGR